MESSKKPGIQNLWLFLTVLAILYISHPAEGVTIRLKDTARVKGNYVELSEIADIKGGEPWLGEIRISRVPPMERLIPSQLIRRKLGDEGVEGYTLVGDAIRVVPSFCFVGPFLIKEMAEDYIRSRKAGPHLLS